MNYSLYSDAEWTYPDSAPSNIRRAYLETALGGHASFQLLGEAIAPGAPVSITLQWDSPCGLTFFAGELLPAGVNENTAPTFMTTADYDICRDYVTRKAPFYVYDAIRPVSGYLSGKRLALYLRLYAAYDVVPGMYHGTFRIQAGNELILVPVSCLLHPCRIPDIHNARLGMLNFFDYEGIERQHHVPEDSAAYWELYRSYIRAQLEMRCTHILLPPARPVLKDGAVSGFDFSRTEKAGRIAMEEGAPYLCGGHIAHWEEWTGTEYYLSWAPSVGTTTREGYRQLRMYFTEWADIVQRNRWAGKITQALADEPQDNNASAYRILACIFRKFLPGVPILDAVETADLGGGIDIWVPKQDTYEKQAEAFRSLQNAGEEVWFYTCAFPGGPIMNRSMDLPLAVSRLILWMGAYYQLSGFLHWGFNYYIGDDIWNQACCPHKGALLPAGDAHIVYPSPDGPWISMRYEAQRSGAEEYELFHILAAASPVKAAEIISMACTGFGSYSSEPDIVMNARSRLLAAADSL